ncbi:hypothetical protein QTP88_026709 [Uroleucon formosanum]
MALNEEQILSVLDDGTDSDLDILNSESENELEDLLNKFANDDFSAELDNEMLANIEIDLHEEDDQTTNETQQSGNEVFDITPVQFKFVQKKEIKWINKPFQEPYINLTDLEPIDCPSTIPQPYEYFTKYFDQKIYEDISYYINLYAVQNNDFLLNLRHH